MHIKLRHRALLYAGCAVLLTAAADLARAADPLVMRNNQTLAAASAYWTPQRMLTAQPMDLPAAAGQGSPVNASAGPQGEVRTSDAHAPISGGNGTVTIHDPASLKSLGGDAGPAAVNPSGQRFTNARVVPMNVLRGQYPWQTVGKLFFVGAGAATSCAQVRSCSVA